MSYMNDIRNAKVVGYGKIFPSKLSPMKVVVFEKGYGYQAVCIDLMLDATGNTHKEVCRNLKRMTNSYIKQMIHDHKDKEDPFMAIREVALAKNELKSMFKDRYCEAKGKYVTDRLLAKKSRDVSMEEIFATFMGRLLPGLVSVFIQVVIPMAPQPCPAQAGQSISSSTQANAIV